jgi:phasin family protein
VIDAHLNRADKPFFPKNNLRPIKFFILQIINLVGVSMNMLVPNFVANQKSGFEIFYSLMAKGLDGFEKLITLNSQAVNAVIVENQDAVVKAQAVKDPQTLFALQTSQTRSATDKAQSYWRQVYEIVSTAHGEFAEVTEAHFKQSQLDAQAFVDGLAKNAPAGSEAVVSAWKSALGVAAESANSAYDAAKKAAKQVVDVAERNVSAASSASTEATRQLVVAGKASGATKK